MLLQEFENLTGIYPSAELYAGIEKAYNAFEGDKFEFCRAYKENKDGLAEKIQRAVSEKSFEERDEKREKLSRFADALRAFARAHGDEIHVGESIFLALEKGNIGGAVSLLNNINRENPNSEIGAAAEKLLRTLKSISEDAGTILHLQEKLEKEEEWHRVYNTDDAKDDEWYLRCKSHGKVLTEEEAKDLLSTDFGFEKSRIVLHKSKELYEVNRHGGLRKCGERERLPVYAASDWNYICFHCGCMTYEVRDGDLHLI